MGNNLSKPMFTLILGFVYMTLSHSCGTKHPQLNELDAILKQNLGRHYNVMYNSSGTMALAVEKATHDHAHKKYKYLVVNVPENTIAHKGTYQSGYVKWIDNGSIEVYSADNIVSDDAPEKHKRIISLNNRQ